MYEIHHADILEWAKNYQGELFDGILCDPPYGWSFMGKSWDYDLPSVEVWELLLGLLKPGAYILVACGTRTQHRMAVNIEDAGFEIRDLIAWVYGSGFPKSLNVGAAVDKLQGNEREVVGEIRAGKTAMGQNSGWNAHENKTVMDATKGTSEWEGYGTALKPAMELWTLARKPLEKGLTVAQNALKHGTGGLNIDGSRVGTNDTLQSGTGNFGKSGIYSEAKGQKSEQHAQGRWPANFIHDGSDEVVDLFPNTKSGAMNSMTKGHDPETFNTYGKQYVRRVVSSASEGSAARFFYCAKSSRGERNAGLEGFEQKEWKDQGFRDNETTHLSPRAGAGRTSPNANHHPTVKPLALTKYLAGLIKPPTGGRLLVPFSGSGSEMIGALQAGWSEVVGVELTEEYIPIAEARIKHWTANIQEKLL